MSLYFKWKDQVIIDGQTYSLNSSFDNILRTIALLNDSSIPQQKQINHTLINLVDESFEEEGAEYQVELIEMLLNDYVKSNEQKKQYDLLGNEIPDTESEDAPEKTIDVDEDWEYIYAAFMQAYQIDLIEEQGKMHYKKFTALLKGLPNDTKMSEIMGIRAWKPQNSKKKESTRMRELQKEYRLKGDSNG